MQETHEFLGDIALKVSPLTGRRNEAIHGYLRLNWDNVKAVKLARDMSWHMSIKSLVN